MQIHTLISPLSRTERKLPFSLLSTLHSKDLSALLRLLHGQCCGSFPILSQNQKADSCVCVWPLVFNPAYVPHDAFLIFCFYKLRGKE